MITYKLLGNGGHKIFESGWRFLCVCDIQEGCSLTSKIKIKYDVLPTSTSR